MSFHYLLIIIIIFTIFKWNKSKNIFDLSIIFNFISLLYFYLGLNIYALLFGLSNLVTQLSYDAFFCIISFNICYNLVKEKNILIKQKYWLPDIKLIFFFFIFSALLELLSIIGRGGLIGRVEAFSYLYENKYLFLNKSIQFILYYIISYKFYVFKGNNKIFYITTCILFLFGIIHISRADLFNLIFINLYFINLTKTITPKKIISYSLILLIIFIGLKPILYSILLDQNYGNDSVNYSELINWVRNSVTAINSNVNYPYNSYLVTLEGVINPIISNKKPLTNWYMDEFFQYEYLSGARYGFSGIAEGYMNGSRIYNIIAFGVFGLLFKKANNLPQNIFGIFLRISIILIMYKLFRSESYNFFRTITYMHIIPFLVIYILSSYLGKTYSIIKKLN